MVHFSLTLMLIGSFVTYLDVDWLFHHEPKYWCVHFLFSCLIHSSSIIMLIGSFVTNTNISLFVQMSSSLMLIGYFVIVIDADWYFRHPPQFWYFRFSSIMMFLVISSSSLMLIGSFMTYLNISRCSYHNSWWVVHL